MNQPALRLARPEKLPAPRTGDDSLQVLSQAIDGLAPPAHRLLARRLRRPPPRPGQPHRPGPTAPAPSRPPRARPGTHLGPDRRAPEHHCRHSGTPLPEQTMINLTRITGIMPHTARQVARCRNRSQAPSTGSPADADGLRQVCRQDRHLTLSDVRVRGERSPSRRSGLEPVPSIWSTEAMDAIQRKSRFIQLVR
jgi:hypothetical protein